MLTAELTLEELRESLSRKIEETSRELSLSSEERERLLDLFYDTLDTVLISKEKKQYWYLRAIKGEKRLNLKALRGDKERELAFALVRAYRAFKHLEHLLFYLD
ncbi:MAG: hypothetical protein ACK42C_00195 [Aquificaceae bacterium]